MLGAAVLLLGILGASPVLHATLHADAAHADHVCAVTLFAQGVEGLGDPIFVAQPLRLHAAIFAEDADAIRWESPRYWLLPAHAPPRLS